MADITVTLLHESSAYKDCPPSLKEPLGTFDLETDPTEQYGDAATMAEVWCEDHGLQAHFVEYADGAVFLSGDPAAITAALEAEEVAP